MVIHSAPPAFRRAWLIGGGAGAAPVTLQAAETKFDGRHGRGLERDHDADDITKSARWADGIEAKPVGLLGRRSMSIKHEHKARTR